MSTQAENTKRIAKNTLMLYVRMLFSMLVSLYTSRVVLNTLGVEDFGIYNVVGGFVGMFSLLTGSISAAISRFLTFELGTGNKQRLSQIFSSSVIVQSVMAIVIVLLLETVGVWFLNSKMIIPSDRLFAANCLLHVSTLSFAIGLISVPYNASIVSHERMDVFAYIGIGEVLVRLFIVCSLAYLPVDFDKLICFAVMTLLLSLLLQFVYWSFCRYHFEECRFKLRLERVLLKQMLGFSGWNFIGASSAVLRDQGGNVILNLFFGPAVNAARGIASSVNNAICGFSGNFMAALNPQITKSYAAGEVDYNFKLIYMAARFSFYLMFILALPVLSNTSYIIHLWLGQIPEHVVLFVQLIVVFSLCETLSNPLITVMLATGNIRNYQIVVGGLQMLNLPISYIVLRMGAIPESVMLVAIALSLACFATRLFMLHGMIGLSIQKYIKKVLLNICSVAFFSIVPVFILSVLYDNSFEFFVLNSLLCVLIASLSAFYIGCNIRERHFIKDKFFAKLLKFVK